MTTLVVGGWTQICYLVFHGLVWYKFSLRRSLVLSLYLWTFKLFPFKTWHFKIDGLSFCAYIVHFYLSFSLSPWDAQPLKFLLTYRSCLYTPWWHPSLCMWHRPTCSQHCLYCKGFLTQLKPHQWFHFWCTGASFFNTVWFFKRFFWPQNVLYFLTTLFLNFYSFLVVLV